MTNKEQPGYLIPLIASVAIIIGVFMGNSLSTKNTVLNDGGNYFGNKLVNVLELLDREYVDSIDKEHLFEQTISQMLHKLDPHSNYIPASELKRMTESIQGQFGGIGVRFAIIRDTLCITNVIENGPAYFQGVQMFDQIIAVDGDTVANVGLRNTQVQEKLKGEAGTKVSVTILRNGKTMEKTIQRGMVPINSVIASFMMDKETGYIRLNQFSMTSDKEFFNAALDLKNQGMKNLILDLRYNGGGVMGSAVNIADALLPAGVQIVSTKGKRKGEDIEYSRNPPLFGSTQIVVLINQSSASASEIVAGAIQDNDRGTIVGRRSFGKGLVQQDLELKDGSNLRLTTSRYYTPTGRCIQKDYSGDYEDYMMDEYNRYESGELYAVDSSMFVDSLKFYTPKGKVVYGGGGIMPDIFVPLDTTGSSSFYRHLQYANVFGDFAFDYVRFNTLTKWSDFKSFAKGFTITDQLLKEFFDYAEKNYRVRFNEKEFKHSKERIKTDLKAEIARQIWLENGSIYIRNKKDNEVEAALNVFRNEL